MMTFKELREGSGMNKKQFAEYFDIPYRTVQNWEAGVNKCPDYLLNLMEYKLQHEGLIRADMEKGNKKRGRAKKPSL
jgi:DNA-binding transcriptional regulator YiaG